ncbi:MAG: zinc-binding alcohol dehydrogenase [Chloroflexi bacterium]|nr:zinc-binding alcohol dehydrogenase [Chloroflexota bacterium]
MKGERLLFSQGPLIERESFDVPAPGPGQVLVRNTHTHVSAGSEMNFLRHGPVAYGLKPGASRVSIGYMTVGSVEQVGPGVANFAPGDRVVTGGNHASHTLVDLNTPAFLDKVPDGVPSEWAGFVALGDVALHGVRRASLQIDQSVAVFGMGMVGQLTAQFASLSGASPVIGVDLVDARLDKALKYGSTHVVNAGREDAVAAIRTLTGAGAEAVFHCTQVAGILQSLMECAAERGILVLTGSPPGTATIRLQEELLRRELTIVGNYELGLMTPHAYWRWTRQRNRRACLRLMAEGRLNLGHLITHVAPYTDAQKMFEMLLRGSEDWLGVVFQWPQ